MVTISVIIPMYNEQKIVIDCAVSLIEELESAADFVSRYEIIFSDDGSSDGCGDMAAEFASSARAGAMMSRGEIRVIRSDENCGKGHAVRLGMLAAHGDISVFTDCDLAYGARAAVDIARELAQSWDDVMIGSRAIHPDGYRGYTPLRKIASKAYLRLLSVFAGLKFSDSQCGLKAFRGSSAAQVFGLAETNGWAFDLELLMLSSGLGMRVGEYPVCVINHRESKVRLLRDSLRMVRDVVRIKRRVKSVLRG